MTSIPEPTSSFKMRLIAWLTLGVYFLVAICMTHMPRVPTELNHFSDKYLHFAGYAVYAGLLYIALGLNFPRLRGLAIWVMLFFAGFAALDELTQPWFGRDCDILDWRADMLGVTAAVLVLTLLRWTAARFGNPARARAIGS
ncbi:MAG: VanZ family protein [Tepidisphaeraceae bacterium]